MIISKPKTLLLIAVLFLANAISLAAGIDASNVQPSLPRTPQPTCTIRLVITVSEATHGDNPTALARSIANDYGKLETSLVARGETSFVLFVRPDQLPRIELDPRIGNIDGIPASTTKPQVTTAVVIPPSAIKTTSLQSATTKPSLRKAPNAPLDPTPTRAR